MRVTIRNFLCRIQLLHSCLPPSFFLSAIIKEKQAWCNQTQKELRHSDEYCFVDNSAVR